MKNLLAAFLNETPQLHHKYTSELWTRTQTDPVLNICHQSPAAQI